LIAPFFTAIFAHLFLDGEKLRFQFLVGFVVALAGIFLISFNGYNTLFERLSNPNTVRWQSWPEESYPD
jgi:drug/metabolite transporter (DMT)-like permease